MKKDEIAVQYALVYLVAISLLYILFYFEIEGFLIVFSLLSLCWFCIF